MFWLWFWLKEDRLHPEPRRLLMLTFLGGMLMVALALLLEQFTVFVFRTSGIINALDGFLILFFWAGAEEISKYLAASKIALNKKEYDEPVDALIYMITAALGFAALENVIFLTDVVGKYGLGMGLATSNLRFIGASLTHLLSSAAVGASIAFCFFHKEKLRVNLIWGLFFGTLLHALFNYFIIKSSGEKIFQIIIPLWFFIIVLLLVFEKVKNQVKKGGYGIINKKE